MSAFPRAELINSVLAKLPPTVALYPEGDQVVCVTEPTMSPGHAASLGVLHSRGAALVVEWPAWAQSVVGAVHSVAAELIPARAARPWSAICAAVAHRIAPERIGAPVDAGPGTGAAIRRSRRAALKRAMPLPSSIGRHLEAGRPVLIVHAQSLVIPLDRGHRRGAPVVPDLTKVERIGPWFASLIDQLEAELPTAARTEDPAVEALRGYLSRERVLQGRFPHEFNSIRLDATGRWCIEHDVGNPFLMGVRSGKNAPSDAPVYWIEWNDHMHTWLGAHPRDEFTSPPSVPKVRARVRKNAPQRRSKTAYHPFIHSVERHVCMGPSLRDAMAIRGPMKPADHVLLALSVASDVVRYGWRATGNGPYTHVGSMIASAGGSFGSLPIRVLDGKAADAWQTQHPDWERINVR